MKLLLWPWLCVLALAAGSWAGSPPLGVAELLAHPDAHGGAVTVEGVVARALPNQHLIALIDAEEYRKCGVVTCADATLPVRWQGAMPEPKTRIEIEGSIEKQGMRKVFTATRLEVKTP